MRPMKPHRESAAKPIRSTGALPAPVSAWLTGCDALALAALIIDPTGRIRALSAALQEVLTQAGQANYPEQITAWTADDPKNASTTLTPDGKRKSWTTASWLATPQADVDMSRLFVGAWRPKPTSTETWGLGFFERNVQPPSSADKSPADLASRLLQGAAHELRNRLTGLSYAAEAAVIELEKGRLAGALHFVQRFQQGMDTAHALLSNLLNAQRLHLGQWTPRVEPITTSALAHQTHAWLENVPIPDRNRVEFLLGSENLVQVDPELVGLVWRNLLANALRFSVAPSLVETRIQSAQQKLTITVLDRGIGIPAGEAEALGKPFLHASNAGQRGGLGLGLFVARSAVEAQGGSLALHPRLDGGTLATAVIAV